MYHSLLCFVAVPLSFMFLFVSRFPDMALAAKCEAAVLEYLTKQNRPYSVNDVVLNLHKEHGKSAVQKALDVLVADARVKEKVGGGWVG